MKKLLKSLFYFLIVGLLLTACSDDDTPTEAPVASAGDNQEVYEGATVTLDASESYDDEGYDIYYEWTAPSGITLSSTTDAQPTFTAPEVTEDTEYEFTLTVDNGGLTTDATVTVNVLQSDVAYVFNYGSWGNGLGSVDYYNLETGDITNEFYQSQNSLELTANIQSACQTDSAFYIITSESDGILVVDRQMIQSIDKVTTGLATCRNAVAYGDYLYISNWGETYSYDESDPAFIAKFNTTTNTVDETISVPGGAEGLAIANGNLYVALNYSYKIAVISLSDNSVSYIETPAVTSYFLKDDSDNLYVSLLSTYSDASDSPGLGYINTSTNTLEATYYMSGMTTNYCSILTANSDFSIIYTVGTGDWYQDDSGTWVQDGAVKAFDVTTSTFSTLIDGLTGVNGLVVNPADDDEIFVFGGGSTTEGGFFDVYDSNGTLQSENTCGVSPYWALFLDVEN